MRDDGARHDSAAAPFVFRAAGVGLTEPWVPNLQDGVVECIARRSGSYARTSVAPPHDPIVLAARFLR